MLEERILIAEGGARERILTAADIHLEDIAFLGVFLDELDQRQLLYAENTARKLLEMIQSRRNNKPVVEEFTIEVPDLQGIGMQLCNEERRYLMEFWSVYVALVKHLLPEASLKEYRSRKSKKAGVRYTGQGWI